jgi:hypothetical protein
MLLGKENGMRRATIFQAAMVITVGSFIISFIGSCAKTISGSSANTAQNCKYYNAASEKEQAAYFEKVKGHFQQIGRPLNDDQVRQHTASIFIVTIPPAAEVYDDTTYMGKANGQLYFTPGKHKIVLRKGAQQKSNVVDFSEGKNLSIVVKL